MMLDATLAYLHFLAILILAGLMSAEALLLRASVAPQSARWLFKLDAGVGVAAVAVLVSGLSRALWGAKGWAYYAHNPVFHAKLGLFLLIAAISIIPTVQFMRWARRYRELPGYTVPAEETKRARRWVMIELHLLPLLPLFGVMMSRGMSF
jgi:putative membrane protein